MFLGEVRCGVAGWESNSGSKFLAGSRPGHSAYLVRRLREAGFVIVGITNLPEFGILPTTATLKVQVGQTVRGGETVIAVLH